MFLRRISLCLLFSFTLSTTYAATLPAPGTIVSSTPISGAPDDASAWRILYRSLDESGSNIEVSGVVVVPKGPAPASGRDIVSWGHSTVGIEQSCAPSTTPGLFKNIAGLPEMLAHGWVVAATDFPGLGTRGPHPYLVGITSGRAMLDAVRAARALSVASAGTRYALWGESQGAHAALWAAQLAPTYAPELHLVGVAAAAPPTDLIANFAALTNPGVRALMTGYTSDTWSQIYHIPLSTFANGIGRFFIRRLARDCLRLDPVSSLANVSLLLASHQLPDHLGKPWTKPLQDNSVKPQHLAVPMMLIQDDADEVVIPKITKAYAKASCRLGDVIRYLTISDAGHSTVAAKGAAAAVAWIADRFAGRPPPSDCDRPEVTLGAR